MKSGIFLLSLGVLYCVNILAAISILNSSVKSEQLSEKTNWGVLSLSCLHSAMLVLLPGLLIAIIFTKGK